MKSFVGVQGAVFQKSPLAARGIKNGFNSFTVTEVDKEQDSFVKKLFKAGDHI
jgi:hypothetical protein